MTLLTLYLQFFNSGSAWTVYAARDQETEDRWQRTEDRKIPFSSSETLQEWTQRKLFWAWIDKNF